MSELKDFLSLFGHTGKHVFQIGADKKHVKLKHEITKGKNLIGTIEELTPQLQHYNKNHAFCSFTVNKTNLQNRKMESITKVTAYFADLDGTPLLPLIEYPLEPSIIVNTSPEKYHLYWLINDAKLSDFFHVQTELSTLMDSCRGVRQVNQAMRMPTFYHMKGKPYRVNIVKMDDLRYDAEEFNYSFAIAKPRKKAPPLPREAQAYKEKYNKPLKASNEGRARVLDNIRYAPEGSRNQTLLAQARALANDVVAKDLAEEDFRNMLTIAAHDAGLEADETRITINQALSYARGVN